MRSSYKFAWIKRDDDVHISQAKVNFYEGEIVAKTEREFLTGQERQVNKYQQTSLTLSKIFTPSDFGVISSDDELRVFLNGELKKDKTRTPIDEQNTLDIKKAK